LNKRQKREDEKKKDEKKEKKEIEVIDVENQLDEKEEKQKDEKKEREVKEDLTAAALPVTDPDLVVGTIDKDLICSICFCLLTKPAGLIRDSLFSFPLFVTISFLCRF
jgi:hypothetical protein